jgi:hypothetical protein
MAKKNFSGGLNSLLGENPTDNKRYSGSKVGDLRPNLKRLLSSQEGTKENETRAAFIVKRICWINLKRWLTGIEF